MSKKSRFNLISNAKLQQLKTATLKKKRQSKMDWGVKAFMDWREERLEKFYYDVGIYFSDLNDLSNLKLENFHHALCYFIPEVTKSKGEGEYPGSTLYQLVVVI